jgi:uncharacterized protein (TIGR00369 family)
MTDAPFEAPYPFQEHLGFAMTGWGPDFARCELPLAPHHGNRYGLPHGGIHATLLDTVMGFCGCFTGSAETRRFAMTLSLNTQFLSRPKGKLLIAEGRRTGGGSRTFFAEGTVMDETGELCATGTGVFRYRG